MTLLNHGTESLNHVIEDTVKDTDSEVDYRQILVGLRDDYGLTHQQIADLLGAARPAVTHWLSGYRSVSLKFHHRFVRLARFQGSEPYQDLRCSGLVGLPHPAVLAGGESHAVFVEGEYQIINDADGQLVDAVRKTNLLLMNVKLVGDDVN